jgi:hypothetical protein
MADCFWCQEYERAKLEAKRLSDAIYALAVEGVQSYTLDTGQTRVTKTRFDIASLTRSRDKAINDVAVYGALCRGGGSSVAGPVF